DVVNRVPSNVDVNTIRYSLNHGTKLATNYVEVGYPLKVVPLGCGGMVVLSVTLIKIIAIYIVGNI
ncbi:MAG: hypothetical protein U9Q68_11900, partial [Euryarchaeota archaeon]|nr:hypothetical protein [Euryarchaeota archaeon]